MRILETSSERFSVQPGESLLCRDTETSVEQALAMKRLFGTAKQAWTVELKVAENMEFFRLYQRRN